jgi:hypothetical protein
MWTLKMLTNKKRLNWCITYMIHVSISHILLHFKELHSRMNKVTNFYFKDAVQFDLCIHVHKGALFLLFIYLFILQYLLTLCLKLATGNRNSLGQLLRNHYTVYLGFYFILCSCIT